MKTSTAIIVVGGLALVLGGVLLSRRRTAVVAQAPAAPNRQLTTGQQRTGWSLFDPTTPTGASNLGNALTGASNLVDSFVGIFRGDSTSSSSGPGYDVGADGTASI